MTTTTQSPSITAETFSAMQVIFGVGMILDGMDEVKGTRMYSSRVVQALELYDKTMLKNSIWRGSGDAMEEGYSGSRMVARMAYADVSVAQDQPKHV